MSLKNEQMEMKLILLSFFIILISMILMDGVWLAFTVNRFYIPNIGHLFADSMGILPVVIFYILYAMALNVFVVLPAIKNETSYLELLFLGLFFGMVCYGTYDLVNQATLKNWPWIVTVIDIAWGSSLAGCVSLLSTFLTRLYLK